MDQTSVLLVSLVTKKSLYMDTDQISNAESSAMSNKPNLQNYPEGVRVNLLRLHESLNHAIQVLVSIRDQVEAGTYTRMNAIEDAEAVAMTEGIDFVSALMDVAEDECDEW